MDVLAWLTAALLGRPFSPFDSNRPIHIERPLYWRVAPLPTAAIVNMHWGRPDGCRLFSRCATWEYQRTELMDGYTGLLSDPFFRAAFNAGNPAAVAQHTLWSSRVDAIRKSYYSKPFQTLTYDDLSAAATWLGLDNSSLTLSMTPLSTFAGTDYTGGVSIARSSLTRSLPDVSTLMHECTHHMQLVIQAPTYSNTWEYGTYNTAELAAMVVENCVRVSQGWDAHDFLELDAAQVPQASESFFRDQCTFPAPRPPMMPGDLAYQYYVKYGPAFTGDVARDLSLLRAWVPQFERMGSIDLRFFPWDCDDGWMNMIWHEEAADQISPLASTCQTWLAVHGQPSLYCMFVHGDIDAVPTKHGPLTAAAAESQVGWPQLPEASQKAALAFIARCNP